MNYTKKLDEINDGFYLILDELVTLIPNYRTYPKLTVYSEKYGKNLQNFKENQADFFMLKNDMEKDLGVIDKLVLSFVPFPEKLFSLIPIENVCPDVP